LTDHYEGHVCVTDHLLLLVGYLRTSSWVRLAISWCVNAVLQSFTHFLRYQDTSKRIFLCFYIKQNFQPFLSFLDINLQLPFTVSYVLCNLLKGFKYSPNISPLQQKEKYEEPIGGGDEKGMKNYLYVNLGEHSNASGWFVCS